MKSLTPLESSATSFGKLLRGLKDTYGWVPLREIETEDLIHLLEHSAGTDQERESLQRFAPWLRQDLLELLSTSPKKRDQQWSAVSLSTPIGWSGAATSTALRILDCSLALSSSDRRGSTPAGVQVVSSTSPNTAPWKLPVLGGVAGVVLAGGLALAVQVTRYRQEVLCQQQATSEQKAELVRLKGELEKRKRSDTSSSQTSRLQPENPEPLPRPSLPERSSEPPVLPSTPSPSPLPAPPPAPPMAALPPDVPWEGCEQATGEGPPPQPGDIWWPVVGPPSSLEAVRRQCRGDAFENKDGNVQVASFRDRSAAESFAGRLSADSRHPYTFYVGEPTTYD